MTWEVGHMWHKSCCRVLLRWPVIEVIIVSVDFHPAQTERYRSKRSGISGERAQQSGWEAPREHPQPKLLVGQAEAVYEALIFSTHVGLHTRDNYDSLDLVQSHKWNLIKIMVSKLDL